MHLFQNLINNYIFLRSDFIGLTINIQGILRFFLDNLLALAIMIGFYSIGKTLRLLFFQDNDKFSFFVNIALGYITVGTGIGILGFFSLLQTKIIAIYLIAVVLIALYPLSHFNLEKISSSLVLKNIKKILNLDKSFVTWGVVLFVLISFFRLAIPDTGEDGYHTDLPRLYLTSHTSMHETRDLLHVIPYPQLAEMIYLIPIFLGEKDATRFIHFGFYLLIIFLLFTMIKNKESSFAKYAPLLFVTTPVVIRYSSSQYTDFFMVFVFLLSIVLIEKGGSKKNIILSGIIFGAVLSTKIWMLVYLPAVLIYIAILNRHLKNSSLAKLFIIFVSSSLIVPLLWYMRAYIITGDPIYPIFAKFEYLETNEIARAPSSYYFGFNWKMFSFPNMIVLSPLFFQGVMFSVFNYRQVIKKIKHSLLFIFFVVMTLEQLVVKADLGRYLFAWYTVSIIILSAGILIAIRKNKIASYSVMVFYFLIFSYYFLNTLLTLPYGFGWANQNKYLTRILGRDNTSYYDFDHLFNKWISDKDLVATYGLGNFYYADFSYIDVNYIFSKNNRSFYLLKDKHVTKLLIKGRDINWFCKRLSLTNCDSNNVKLLATYPADVKKYNLYSLKK